MHRKCWLLLSFSPVLAALLPGCSSRFDSCEARRTCASTGSPGNAGGGGGDLGEAGAGPAGSDENEPFPSLFDACSRKGEVACVGHAQAQRFACDGKRWQAATTCAADELCDSRDGTCAATVSECASAKPGGAVCRGDTTLKCGPDLVSASEEETCVGVCQLGVCKAPACGDEKLEPGEDCDDAEMTASGACVQCKTARCGDRAVYEGHEQCDDGNEVSGDGCNATCRAEPVALALGDQLSCALSSTGLVKCWGDNTAGALGLGDTVNRGDVMNTVPSKLKAIDLGTGRSAIAISARGGSVCALLDHGDVKCWGSNLVGQLGTGDTEKRGDQPEEMGDALKPIPLGAGLSAIGVSAAATHTCVVLNDGTVKCWGSKEHGQLGQGTKADVFSPERLAPIKFSSKVSAISASNFLGDGKGGPYGGATCALLEDGSMRCWGSTEWLPNGSSADLDGSNGTGDLPGEMDGLPALGFSGGRAARSIVSGSVFAVVLDDASVRLWGSGSQLGQPNLGSTPTGLTPESLATQAAVQMGKKVKSIDVGKEHACAILEDGSLKCWGQGFYGALGLGSTASTDKAPKDIPAVDLGGAKAKQVAAGKTHTCVILDDGSVKCWGDNSRGQLGLGDIKARGETGETLSADTTVDLSF